MTKNHKILVIGIIVLVACLTRLPAINTELQGFPGDTVKWAAPAVNFSIYGFEDVKLPRIDQGDYAEMVGEYYYRWPLLPYYVYGVWAATLSNQTEVLRLAPLLLNLITTVYLFLIFAKLFRQKVIAIPATLLFIFVPGHSYMSVQIADIQFWLLALTGAMYHKIEYERLGSLSQLSLHFAFLMLGCLSSWFGFLSVFAFMCLGVLDGWSANNQGFYRYAFNLYKVKYLWITVFIMLFSAVTHFAVVYILAGSIGIENVLERFDFWVTNTRDDNAQTAFFFRILSEMPAMLSNMLGIHLPRVFGVPLLIGGLLLILVSYLFFRESFKRVVSLVLFKRVAGIYLIIFFSYIVFFARHAERAAHSFTYQILSPLVVVLVIAAAVALASKVVRNSIAVMCTTVLCLALVLPDFIESFQNDNFYSKRRANKINEAREMGGVANRFSDISDFVLTNRGDFDYFTNATKYLARRTMGFSKNTHSEISQFVDNNHIDGVVFIHWHKVKKIYKIDENLSQVLQKSEKISVIPKVADIYRLK